MHTSTRKNPKSSHFSPYFIKRLSSWLVLSTALTLAATHDVRAAAVSWEGDTGGSPGDAVSWTDANNWTAVPSGVTPGDDLTFGLGTVGTINLGGNQFANSIVFNAGFTLSAPATADQLTITTGLVTANAAATINSVIAGSAGLTLVAGSTGSLTLTADNSATLTGTIAVDGGTLSVGADNNLGNAGNAVTISNAATLSSSGTFSSARLVTLGSGGARIGVTGVNTMILTTGLDANANALTKVDTGTLKLTAGSLRTGTTTINAGTLSADVATGSNALGSGAVNLSGGTLELTPVAAQVAGISGRVFTTSVALGDSSRQDFTGTATSLRTDTDLNFGGLGVPNQTAIQWLGKIRITLADTYNFGTASDDGSRLFIDGVLVINNDGSKGVTDSQNTVFLSTGLHDVRVDFMQGTGGSGEILRYSGLDQPVYGAVPGAVLFQAETNTLAGASNAVVLGNDVNVTASSTINLNGSDFTQVQIGNLAQNTGTTLSVSGLSGKTVRVGGTATLGNGAGTVTIVTAPDIAFDGVVTDSGNAMTITKNGSGRLIFDQTAVANTLVSGTNFDIQGGALVLVGSTAPGAFNPIGSASVTLAGGNLILDSKGATVTGVGNTYSNNISATGAGGTIQDIVNAATTTLSGTLAVGASTITLDAIAGGQPATDPAAALVLSGPITGSGTLNIASTRLGSFATAARGTVSITGNLSGYSGAVNVTPTGLLLVTTGTTLIGKSVGIEGGGIASFLFDGNGSGTPGSSPITTQNTLSQNVSFADNFTISGTGTATLITGRLGTTFAPLFTQAQNKTAQMGTLSIGAQTLAITNNNGYGVDFLGATSLTGAASFSPATATASNVVPGLTLSGAVSSTGSFVTTKAGAGTLLLTNPANTFTGNINVTGGALAVASDGALGNAANEVILNGAGATLRAVGTGGVVLPVTRVVQINSAANSFIEVAGGQTLTIDSAFGGAAGAGWTKAESGILILKAANANTGASTINAGAVRIANGAALGTAAATVGIPGVTGAALQLDGSAGSISVPNQIVLNTSATNQANGGINFGGQLENFAGTNTVTGVLTLNADVAVGATAGVLNINGGIHNPTATGRAIAFTGAGTINLNSNITAATATANQYFAIRKYGSGILNFTTASSIIPTDAATGFQLFGGTTNLSGAGTITGGSGVPAQILPGATLNLTDSGAPTSRLGGRGVTVSGGTFNYTGNAGNSAETFGALSTNFAANISSNQTGAGTVALTFASAAFGGNGASIAFSGTNLGTATNKIIITAAPTLSPVTSGILSRAIITSGGGFDFVSYNHTGAVANTNGIQAFANYNIGNNIDTAATTDTLNITAAPVFSAAKTINAFKVTGTGINVAATGTVGNTPTQMILTSGGIAVTGGSNTISVPAILVGAGTTEIFAHVNLGSTLTLSSALGAGATGFTKADGGTLILAPVASAIAGITPSNVTGTFNNNGGTLQLGSNNAYTPNQFLRMGPGAMLDLNGKLQAFRGIISDTSLEESAPGQYGTITSVAGTGNLVTNLDNSTRSWAGQITGAVNLLRSGENTWSVFSNNTYTGNTTINGGTTTLRDGGRLSGTDAIGIHFANLVLDNNAGFRDEGNRIKDTATVTLRGGVINLIGRAQTASSETIGTLVLGQGSSNITVTAGGTGVNSADLTFGSLTQQNNATINIQTLNGQIGSAGRLHFTTAPTLTNGILPYAIFGGNELINYIPGLGIAAINAVGARGYDGTAFPASSANATQNLKLSNNTFTVPDALSGSYELNAISWGTNTAGQSINFTDGTDVLNLTSGLLNKSGNIVGNIGATLDSGRLTAGGNVAATGLTQNLYLTMNGGGNALTVNSRIINNPNTDPVRLVYTPYNGFTLLLANNLNSYTGGTVVNGGVAFTGILNVGATGLIPAGGLTINHATVTQTLGGVIDASNVVTLNGGAVLTLTGNNTLAGLAFNHIGGSTTLPVVNTSSGGIVGTLTIGASGITGTSSNVSTTPVVAGRVDFGATAKTIALDPISFNGEDINPTQGTLALQGIVGSAGGITKTGNGSLTLNAQQVYTGPTNVTGGGIIANFGGVALTGPVAGSRFSAYTFAAGTRLNLINDAMIGSLAGGGIVTNSSTTDRTFGTGFDNSATTFSGQFLRFSDARLTPFTVNKFGTGTMTLTGVSNNNNSLVIRGGGVTFAGAGRGTFGTDFVFSTGTLTLDNRNAAGGNLVNRLGGATAVGTLNAAGGNVVIYGNETAATPTSETIGTLTFSSGGSVMTLNADPANPLTLTVGTTFSGVQGGGAALLRGDNFGNAPGNGVPTIALGAIALGAPTGAGTGANGSQTMPIRPDLIGGNTAASLGTAFITKDSVGNYLRPLAVGEMAVTLNTATATATNVAISANNVLTGAATTGLNTAFSLALNSGGGISLGSPAAFGLYGANSGLVQTKIGSGGILALAGNLGITSGQIDTSNNTAFHFHTVGAGTTLALNGYLGTTNGGLVKSDAGSVSIDKVSYYTGATTVNAGLLSIGTGISNTIQVVTTAGAPTLSALRVNGGAFELNGTSQMVGTIDSNSFTTGGSIRNTAGGPAATLTSVTGGAVSFGGSIDGNLNFVKTGNNEMILTNPGTYTGTTTIRGNNLRLRDAATLASTSYDINYGGLILDNSALTPLANLNPTRVAAASTINLRGGTLSLIGGGSVDTTASFTAVNALQGHNTLTVPAPTTAGTAALTIGNLVTANSDVTVTFTGGSGGFFNAIPGFANSEIFLSTINGNAIPANITNKILGGWAVTNNGEFTTYVQSGTTGANGINYGIVTMNGVAAIGQTQYDSNAATLPASSATSNVRLATGTANTTAAVPTGGANYNVLAVRQNIIAITFAAAGDTMNFTAGGLALTQGGTVVGTAALPGKLVGGGTAAVTSPLYIYSAGNSNTINSIIADSGVVGAKTRLVAVPIANSLILQGINTYTGGTVVNGSGGTLNLNGATPSAGQVTAGQAEIPAGGLTLNNALVTMTTNQGQIDPTNIVTLNGGSSLTMFGTNTLPKVIFNNTGGFAATPTLATATALTLNAADAITVTNDNVGSVPTISGTALLLSNAAPVISTSGIAPTSLTISAPIIGAGGAISKTGAGSVVLSGANTFSTGFNLNQGTLIFGVGSVGTPPTLTSGPVGTGILSLANGTTVLSTNNFTVGNATSVAGDFTFGGTTTIGTNHNLTLSGVVTLAAGVHAITVSSPFVTGTISGQLTGGTNLTKSGPGILTLSNNTNNYGGTTSITGGVLKLGAVAAIPAATSDVSISTGAVLDINNQDNVVLRTISGAGLLTNSGGSTRNLYLGGITTTDSTTTASSTFDGVITNAVGAVTIRKVGVGTVTLTGANSFTGGVFIGASNTVPGGQLQITNSLALGVGAKTATIISNNTPVGNQAQLLLDGSTANGPVILGSNIGFTLSQGSLSQPSIVNVAGNNIINGNTLITAGGGSAAISSAAGSLTLAGNFTTNQPGRFLYLTGASTGANTVSGSIGQGSVPNLLQVQKLDAGTWSMTGATANTYTGLTTVAGGLLALNKTAGIDAIAGDGLTDKVTDILINGGTLRWDASNQVGDLVTINMTSGALNINGQTETLYELTNSGGTFTTGLAGILNIPDPTFSGGTSTFNADSVSTFGTLNISGGVNTLQGQAGPAAGSTAGAVLNVGALGGLNFTGAGSPSLIVNADAASGGKVILQGNITTTVTAGLASIASAGAGAIEGVLDLNGAPRTVSVADGAAGVDMLISTDIIGAAGASLTKTGLGTLNLDGAQNYLQLTTSSGITNVNGAFTNGTADINADSTTNFYVSQTVGSLDIAAGVEVTFGDGLPFSGGGGKSGVAALGGSAVVPEPGSVALLLTGALGLLGRRRRKNN